MTTLNNHNITDIMATKLGVTKKQTREWYKTFIETIREELAEGNDVTLNRFLTFEHAERDARPGRNPQTGEPITISARTIIRVKPRVGLKKWRDVIVEYRGDDVAEQIADYKKQKGLA